RISHAIKARSFPVCPHSHTKNSIGGNIKKSKKYNGGIVTFGRLRSSQSPAEDPHDKHETRGSLRENTRPIWFRNLKTPHKRLIPAGQSARTHKPSKIKPASLGKSRGGAAGRWSRSTPMRAIFSANRRLC